jgi:hypothetical protein
VSWLDEQVLQLFAKVSSEPLTPWTEVGWSSCSTAHWESICPVLATILFGHQQATTVSTLDHPPFAVYSAVSLSPKHQPVAVKAAEKPGFGLHCLRVQRRAVGMRRLVATPELEGVPASQMAQAVALCLEGSLRK